jgi:hypothetical protein
MPGYFFYLSTLYSSNITGLIRPILQQRIRRLKFLNSHPHTRPHTYPHTHEYRYVYKHTYFLTHTQCWTHQRGVNSILIFLITWIMQIMELYPYHCCLLHLLQKYHFDSNIQNHILYHFRLDRIDSSNWFFLIVHYFFSKLHFRKCETSFSMRSCAHLNE